MTSSITSFEQLALSPPVLQAVKEIGYESPSPIQAASIPILLAGHDLLGQAQTGTGKTGAFALPLLSHIDLSLKEPQVLVLAPTRELAIQVAEAFQAYARHLKGFHVLPIYGGQAMDTQLRQLKRGVHVVIGTPGRIMDHLRRKTLSLKTLKTLVLDEADEMLRMGFIDDVEWILEQTPPTRQIALFSATMPDAIKRVAQKYLNAPKEVKIKTTTTTVETIEQRFWQVSGLHKLDALTRILEVEDMDAAIIFVRTKTETVELSEKLEARGYATSPLNGDMSQALRERAVESLKNKTLDIIVATDIAARGLDVPRITHVINYDIPYDTEAYVHRIGRTGRAGRKGIAILFVAPREMRMLRAIEKATRQPIQHMQLPTTEAVTHKRIGQFKQQIVDVIESEDLNFISQVVSQIEAEQNITAHEIAAALAFLVQRERPLELKEKERKSAPPQDRTTKPRDDSAERFRDDKFRDKGPRKPANRERPAAASDAGMVRYRIEVGKNQGVMPRDIVGAIANEAGIDSQHIGHIKLYDDFSTIDLPEGMPKDVFQHLQRIRVRQFKLDIKQLDEKPGKDERDRKPSKPREKITLKTKDAAKAPRKEFGKAKPKITKKAPK